VLLAAAGAVICGATGRVLGLTSLGIGVGALNGWFGGARGVYDLRRARGVIAFVLDSSWAAVTTAGALVLHVLSYLRQPGRRPGYVVSLSRRANRHVYAHGYVLRRGFAYSVGNVVTGAAGGKDCDLDLERDFGERAASRRRLVTRHENRHVWQARLFGPAYPVLYVAWMIVATVVATAVWLVRHPAPLVRCVETLAYYDNPFEYNAYRADEYWPPRGAVTQLAWPPKPVRG